MKRYICAFLICLLVLSAWGSPAATFAEWGTQAEDGGDDAVYDPFAHLGEDGVRPEEAHRYSEDTAYAISPFSLQSGLDYRYVRVMLTTDHSAAAVNFHGSYALCDAADNPIFRIAPETDYFLSANAAEGMLEVRSAGGELLYSAAAFYFKEYAPAEGEDRNYFKVYDVNGTDNCYLGELNCWYAEAEDGLETAATGLFLVNRVYIEDYLVGVLPFEIGDDAPAEALKAQAVVARNYAVRSIRSTNIFDVYDTSRSQVYRGIPSNAPNTPQAVQATAGQVLFYNGSPIKAYFSASNGGYTEAANNQWTNENDSGPDVVKEDPYDLAYASTHSYNSGRNPYLETVTIPKQPAGDEAAVQALVNNALLPALAEYPALTAAELRVSGIKMAVNNSCTSDACRRHHQQEPLCSHFCGIDVTFTGTVLANGADRLTDVPFEEIAHIADTDLYVNPASGKPYGFFMNSELGKYWLLEDAAGENYIIRHARYGHGVGLSQVGAIEMAETHKWTCDAILGFYFEGCQLMAHSGIAAPDTLAELPAAGEYQKDYRVLSHDAYVYARANETSIVRGVLRAGECVEALAANDTFTKITYGEDAGYIKNAACETPAYTKVQIINLKSYCQVRKGPGTQYDSLGQAYLNEVYPLVQANEETGWHKIMYNGKPGYVFCKYARLLTPAAAGEEAAIPAYRVSVPVPEGYADTTLWIDGVQHNGTLRDGMLVAEAYTGTATNAVLYRYDGTVPVGMAVWKLTLAETEGAYAAERVGGFDDLLSYHGFSVRIRGNSGIRFKSGIAKATRKALLNEGIAGYKLVEYGTLVFTDAAREPYYPFVRGSGLTVSGRAYWTENGVLNDRVIEIVDERLRFASVLTDIPDDRLAEDFPFRAYILLSNGTDTLTLYGPPMRRSIYRVAKNIMGRGDYTADSEEGMFLNRIISLVENGQG